MQLRIKRLTKDAQIPEYQTKGSAGVDLHAELSTYKDTKIFPGGKGRIVCALLNPGDTVVIPTGLAMEIPYGYEGQIRPRSGLAKQGLVVANAPGTVDSDYRGEIKVMLYNRGPRPVYVYQGDRMAQMIFNQVTQATFEIVEELSGTQRGSGGFGSTGT